MKVELTKEQLDTAVAFLQRITLNAKEVPVYTDLVNVLQKARLKDVDQKEKKG